MFMKTALSKLNLDAELYPEIDTEIQNIHEQMCKILKKFAQIFVQKNLEEYVFHRKWEIQNSFEVFNFFSGLLNL